MGRKRRKKPLVKEEPISLMEQLNIHTPQGIGPEPNVKCPHCKSSLITYSTRGIYFCIECSKNSHPSEVIRENG